MSENLGWIPPSERDLTQRRMTLAFDRETPAFGEANPFLLELPKEALLYNLEIKATGNLLPRYYQLSGSCVGFAGARAYCLAQCGDVVHRGDREEIKLVHPLPTYGKGRQLAGYRSKGEGSFGAAQAQAVKEWGMLAIDDPRLPKATLADGWLKWSSRTEIDWSYAPQWPVKESSLAVDAKSHVIHSVSRVRTLLELKQGLAQGYAGTMACMFGSKNMRVKDGYLVAPWDTRWAHQQAIAGYTEHPSMGDLFAIDNQWNKNAHPSCPKLSSIGSGVNGSYWVTGDTMKKILASEDSEVFLHSNTAGFPPRNISWGNMGIGE